MKTAAELEAEVRADERRACAEEIAALKIHVAKLQRRLALAPPEGHPAAQDAAPRGNPVCSARTLEEDGPPHEYECALATGHFGDHVDGYGLCRWHNLNEGPATSPPDDRDWCRKTNNCLGGCVDAADHARYVASRAPAPAALAAAPRETRPVTITCPFCGDPACDGSRCADDVTAADVCSAAQDLTGLAAVLATAPRAPSLDHLIDNEPAAPAAPTCKRCDPEKPGLMWHAGLENHVLCTDSTHVAKPAPAESAEAKCPDCIGYDAGYAKAYRVGLADGRAEVETLRKELAEARLLESDCRTAANEARERLAAVLAERDALKARLAEAAEFVRSVVEYDEYRDDDEDPNAILGRIEASARKLYVAAAPPAPAPGHNLPGLARQEEAPNGTVSESEVSLPVGQLPVGHAQGQRPQPAQQSHPRISRRVAGPRGVVRAPRQAAGHRSQEARGWLDCRVCVDDAGAPEGSKWKRGGRVSSERERVFTAFFMACGLGAGAMGFLKAMARLGSHTARFKNRGGVDIDELACQDFEMLTGAKATRADISTMTAADLRAAAGGGEVAPDCVFGSYPCKGFSGLLSKASSETAKYQALNSLVLQGMFLTCEAWKRPPATLLLENVPRIRTRGAELLTQVRSLLGSYGYAIHEANHDCGEIGELAQHRHRYLMVARLKSACGAYIYRPPKRRVRACGEVLGTLPLPQDPEAGDLHKLPKLSWLNWVRLALIPAGGDWRDLPGMKQKSEEARKAWEQKGEKTEGETHWFKGKHGVMDWEKPSRAVVGGPSNGASNVADPRADALAEAVGLRAVADGAGAFKGRPGHFGVGDWNEPAPTVTGKMRIGTGSGTAAVADPRTPRNGTLGVLGWEEPAKTVTGESYPSNGTNAVADPRLGLNHQPRDGSLGVVSWDEPAPPVTGAARVSGSNTPASVADPRGAQLALGHEPHRGTFGVNDWNEPAATVRGRGDVRQAKSAVADPRVTAEDEIPEELRNPVPEGAERRSVFSRYAVNKWDEPVPTVAGSGTNGAFAVADERALGLKDSATRQNNKYAVKGWDEPAPTVTGCTRPASGAASVADPRGADLALGANNPRRHETKYAIEKWDEPAHTVTGATRPGSGSMNVADPRAAELAVGPKGEYGSLGVNEWDKPAATVRGASSVRTSKSAVADPRAPDLGVNKRAGRFADQYRVQDWDKPAATVTGNTDVQEGAPNVADPRTLLDDVPLKCRPWRGYYGVISWEEAAASVTGSAQIDNGRFAVADPRKPPEKLPVIIAKDGTWHRPLTTLELAVLQSLPAKVNGKPLKLAGKSVAGWRERIGNAVPVDAAQAIAETILLAFLASALGTWTLGSTGIWVREDGVTEDEANAPYVDQDGVAA